ncbi:MAG: membrane protein insertase YidC [Galactobacter sp.]|uniref:membrane protein insertase YidC n=1 Tax=Galactobacter sp. TaxID=2676125 RepID=UPI0025BAE6D8|nr:membrane protein insertase YidC [Galactobacter sp.]
MGFIDTILTPFKWVMSWLLYIFHELFSIIGLDPDSGWTWALSIVFVTVVVRAALIPLFTRQIRAQRAMQALQPELKKLQAKYKGKKDQLSQQAMLAEQRALFKKNNTGMFSSCLPLLVQMPFFFSLYRVLFTASKASDNGESIAALSAARVRSFDNSSIFSAKLSDTFLGQFNGSGGVNAAVLVVSVVMILAMTASQFFTQRHLMTKNMSPAAQQGPFAQQQKLMLYVLPLVFGIGGINFPIGLLIYWTATNVWTLGQQMWVIRHNPTPGSLAEKELNIRRAAKGLPPVGKTKEAAAKEAEEAKKLEEQKGQRQQPQRKNRRKK